VTKILASFYVRGIARVFCILGQEIFLRPRQQKQWILN